MTKPRDLSCVVCSHCDEIILICAGTKLADEFSVKCAACTMRDFYRAVDVRDAGRIGRKPAQRRSA